jgi:hypothetical protein
MATLLPVAEAAQALSISVSALRRGLKSGKYQGRRQSTPQGFVWLVEVGDDRVGEVRLPDDRVGEVRLGDTPQQEAPASPQTAIQAARAQEMAQYTATLLEPLHSRLEAQAELIGALKERLAAAETRIAELETPTTETQNGATPWPERRRWWQRLVWG